MPCCIVFAFDAIHWLKIDARSFGAAESSEESWREGIELLGEGEKGEMERLVARKVGEMESRVLARDPDEYTAAFHGRLKREKADGAHESEDGVKEDKNNYIEADADGAKHSRTDTMRDSPTTIPSRTKRESSIQY